MACQHFLAGEGAGVLQAVAGCGTEARKVVNSYRALEDKILQVVTDRSVANRLLTDSYTFDEFEYLCRLPFGLVVLQGDSAAFWTSNAIMPVEAQFQANDAPLFITEKMAVMYCISTLSKTACIPLHFCPYAWTLVSTTGICQI